MFAPHLKHSQFASLLFNSSHYAVALEKHRHQRPPFTPIEAAMPFLSQTLPAVQLV